MTPGSHATNVQCSFLRVTALQILRCGSFEFAKSKPYVRCVDMRQAESKVIMKPVRAVPQKYVSICILFLLTTMLFACGGSNQGSSLGPVNIGREVTVNSTVFAASSKPAYDAMIHDIATNHGSEVKKMIERGDVFIIQAGERGLILDSGRFWYQVRFTSGEHSGSVGWFGMEFAN